MSGQSEVTDSLGSTPKPFDSSAPIDLGTSEQTGEEPSLDETGPSTGDEGAEEPAEPPME